MKMGKMFPSIIEKGLVTNLILAMYREYFLLHRKILIVAHSL